MSVGGAGRHPGGHGMGEKTPALPLHLPADELLAWLERNGVTKEQAREAVATLVLRLVRQRAEIVAVLDAARRAFPEADFSDIEAELADLDAKIERLRRPPGERGGDSGAALREGDLLTVAQALRLVPVGRSTLYALIESGELPCYRVTALGSRRGRVLVHRGDLEAFVARARHVAPTAAVVAPDVDALLSRVRARRRGIGPPNGESG